MDAQFEVGQKVRHKTQDLTGTILSRDEESAQVRQVFAPNVTYTVEWDEPVAGMKKETLVDPRVIEPCGG